MAYVCRDCSYRGATTGPSGQCPACDSFNFGRQQKIEARPQNSKPRVQVLITVWAIFIGMIIWKLLE
ncbi:MAG: putative ATP-dependent serine protease [Halieaceae bacterium]|jgi:predicted ATP-dependent serine protease